MLILLRGERPQVEAEATTGRGRVEVALRRAPVEAAELPQSALQYAIRTHERVLLEDAAASTVFSEDAYVQQRRPRSVLCLPLLKQARLIGVVYLENTLAPRVFTPARLAVLEVLASQAAIALENARLYGELAQENRERKQAQEALRASEQRLQDIVDTTTAVIFVKDLELRYVLINREYERRFGVQRDQVRGKTDFDLHSPEVAQMGRASDRQVIDAGVPLQFEQAAPLAVGGERSYVVVKFLLRDPTGQPYALCGIATDITEAKRAQQLQAAVLEERNRLAGEIHDSLAQLFTGISMQLGAAKAVLTRGDNQGLTYLERAAELAQFGLAEARRSAYSLQPSLTEGANLVLPPKKRTRDFRFSWVFLG